MLRRNAMVIMTMRMRLTKSLKKLKKKLKALQIKYKDNIGLDEMRKMTDIVIERVYNEENLNQR